MSRQKKRAVVECCCVGAGACPCCPGWPLTQSGIINWITTVETNNDCEIAPTPVEVSTDFSCDGSFTEAGQLIRTAATELWVRVYCVAGEGWKVQYRSAVTGGGFESPVSATWRDAPDVDFVCPDCADAVDGVAYGTIDFTAIMACEVSGPTIVEYNVLVHGEIEIGCL